ncbi:NepR family anti-sigma factor [Tateyamaria armeniaca]|uniref:NepR family anti-sigma factor n=1 Tax=Tateyamaria armeniaca TaxID=2518930 RepID=A0ABW8UX75_9RHOB
MEPNALKRRLFRVSRRLFYSVQEGLQENMAQDEKRPRAKDTIDANLKRVYQEALEEDVPDRFKDLLEQLKAQDAQGKTGSGE